MDELIYIQTAPGVSGTLELHAENEITTFPGNLKELATKYTNLCRCHKSILINPAHVLRLDITNRFVYMDNQDKLEVSIRRMGELRNILTGTRALS
ncbi:LytR/AlgR family response regulator [Lacticaseibacillus rhamnosus]|nr:LytR/AlgR family response regulator [Lacticaseibacillus rhamnosus]